MKPVSHVNVTKLALDIYQTGNQSMLSFALQKHRFREALLRGTKDEDGISYSRATNWHFYPANDVLNDADLEISDFLNLVIRPTSDKVMAERQESFIRSLKDGASEFLFVVFGRMLHHIQDMNTPSHVIPVYHGPKVPDRYESFLKSAWGDIEQRVSSMDLLTEDMSTEQSDDFVALYRSAAQRLLSLADSGDFAFPVVIDGRLVTGGMNLLWQGYVPDDGGADRKVPFDIEGFGRFGPVGLHFGVTVPFEEDESTYLVSHDVYATIAAGFVRAAVLDTVRALKQFELLVGADFSKRPFVEETNPFLEV